MRTKEVDNAINIVSNVRTSLMNFNELVNEHKDIIDSVETVLNYIFDLEETNRLLLNNNAKKSEEINKLKCENHDMKEQLQFFIPRRRVRRVYKQLGKILKQDGITDDLDEV